LLDSVVVTAKSLGTLVVGPALSLTVIVQLIEPPTTTSDGALHISTDAVEGVPETTNVGAPFVRTCPPARATI